MPWQNFLSFNEFFSRRPDLFQWRSSRGLGCLGCMVGQTPMSLTVIGLDEMRAATAPQLALIAGRMAKLFRLVRDGVVLVR
jgi:hypothetical protein